MTSTEIPVNQCYKIDSILDSTIKIHLIERGFISNVEIIKVYSLFEKGPFIFKVGQTLYSLRSEESDLVIVK